MSDAPRRLSQWAILSDRVSLWIVAALFAGAFFAEGYAADSVLRTSAWLACAALGCLGIAGWAAGRGDGERWNAARWFAALMLAAVGCGALHLIPIAPEHARELSPLWRDILDSLAAGGIAAPESVTLAIAPEHARRALNQLIASALFFIGIVPLASRRSGAVALVSMVAVAAVAEGIVGLFQFLAWGLPRARGAVFNPNHHAATVLMGLPLCFAGLVQWRRLNARFSEDLLGGTNPVLLLYGVGVAATLGWLAAFSRSSLLIAILVLAVYVTIEGVGRWRRRERDVRLGIGALAIGTALLAMGAALSAVLVEGVFARLMDDDALSGNSRLHIWAASWRGLQETNWLGLGLGGVEFTINRYAEYPLLTIPIWSHNDWLQWVCDLGVPGVVVLMPLLAAFLASATRDYRARRPLAGFADRMLYRACLAGLATALLHAATDFHLRIPLTGFMVLTLVALVVQSGTLKVNLTR